MIAKDLEELSTATESDFINVGLELRSIQNRARKMSEKASDLAEHMGEKTIPEAISGLEAILARIHGFENLCNRYMEKLESIFSLLQTATSALGEYAKTVQTLETLSTYIKMERAHLGQFGSGFKELADDIETLCREIQNNSRSILEGIAALSERVAQTMKAAHELKGARNHQAQAIINEASSNIAVLSDKHRISIESAHYCGLRSQQAYSSIESIVSSLQFHDITRQQLEHVNNALQKIVMDLNDHSINGREDAHAESRELLQITSDICDLQIAHINNAKQTFSSAIKDILSNLLAVSRNMEEMSEKSLEMSEFGNEGKQSFLAEIEKKLSSLSSTVSSYNAVGEKFAQTVHRIVEAAGDMKRFVTEIETIENKVKLIALNTSVQAAHLGERGAVLSVLASELRRILVESGNHNSTISHVLSSLSTSATSLSDEDICGSESSEGNSGDFSHLLTGINNGREKVAHIFEEVRSETHTLSQDIQTIVSSIADLESASKVFDRTVHELAVIVSLSRSILPPQGAELNPNRFKELKTHYTMEREREIHKSLFRDGEEEIFPPDTDFDSKKTEEKLIADGDENEFGDNIELF